MKLKPRQHTIDSLFAFLLLLIFSLFTLMLTGMGSAIYRSGVAHLDENYTSRTAIAYLSEKVGQHDRAGEISHTEVEGIPAIRFHDTVEGGSFFTYVYFYDGALRELFIREDAEPLAASGSAIVSLAGFAFDTDTESPAGEPLLSAMATSEEGNELSVLIHLTAGNVG